jgi:hypothetical protein
MSDSIYNRDPSKLELYSMAAIGISGGVFKYYIQPELTARRAWAVIATTVLLHDFLCKDGQTLSEGVDRAIEKHPVAVPLAIGVTALHLVNGFDQLGLKSLDPFHHAVNLARGITMKD